jgi:hypothetical protein
MPRIKADIIGVAFRDAFWQPVLGLEWTRRAALYDDGDALFSGVRLQQVTRRCANLQRGQGFGLTRDQPFCERFARSW